MLAPRPAGRSQRRTRPCHDRRACLPCHWQRPAAGQSSGFMLQTV